MLSLSSEASLLFFWYGVIFFGSASAMLIKILPPQVLPLLQTLYLYGSLVSESALSLQISRLCGRFVFANALFLQHALLLSHID